MANKLIGSKGLSKSQIILGFCLIFFTIPPLVAQRTISGFVTDIDKDPLIGVTILIKDYNLGTTTDVDGNYNLEVPEGARFLVFSYIGFADRIVEIGLQDLINPTLRERTSFLDEVVVTGVPIGTPTTKVGFNISKITEDQLSQVPGVNIGIALQSKIPGVQIKSRGGLPGSSPSIRIRGSNNLFGFPSPPLVIIDGIQLQESANLADINSEDIASIEVIKGAAATSLYGSRAGAGVINIRTKRGSSRIGETEITLRNEYGKSSLVKRTDRNQHHAYVVNPDGSVDYSQLDPDHYSDNEYPKVYDHQALFFDPGASMTNSLSIRSRTQESSYFISLNNTLQTGTVSNLDGYGRQSLRANIDHNISKSLKLRFSNYFAQSTSDEPESRYPFIALAHMPAGVNLAAPNEEDGSPYNWDAPKDAGVNTSNPLYDLYAIDNQLKIERYSGSFGLNLRLNPNFNFDVSYSIDQRSKTQNQFIDKEYLAWSFWADGYALRSNGNRKYQTSNAHLTFQKTFKNFSISSQSAIIYEEDESEYFEVGAQDFRFQGIRSLNNSGNQVGNNGGASVNRTTRASNDFKIKSINYYLTGSIDWKDKLILDGLVRLDGSSLFGSNNRWNTFYRTSLAYRLSEDVKIPGVEELKLRVSYGTSGNRPKFNYRFETLSGDGTKNTLGNKDLKSSLRTELEAGIDARFFNQFNLEFTYAHGITSDLFYNVGLAAVVGGFNSQWQNIDSELKTNSLEIALGWEAIRRSDFSLSVDFTFDRLRQEVGKFDFPEFNDFIFQKKAGQSYSVLAMRKFARSVDDLFPYQREGKSFIVNDEGWLVEANKVGTLDERPILVEDENGEGWFIQGDANPDFDLGFSINTSWKNLQAYCLFHWRNGGDIYNETRARPISDFVAGVVDQAGKPEGQKHPLEYYTEFFENGPNNFFLEDGSYLKLREVALSYNFDTATWGSLGNVIKDLRISIIGRNLFTITDYTGYDPEVAYFDTEYDANSYVSDAYGYPNFRTITAALEIKF